MGPIGQEIKCAVSQKLRRCQSHVSQVIAYCLLPSEKVRGHGDHINFFSSPAHSPHSSPSTWRNKERRRERDGDVRLEGELAVEVVGSGIRKKKKNIERESSDQTALIRRGGGGGGGCCGGGREGVMCVFNSGLTPLMLIQPISSFISFLEPKSAICDKVAVATACSPGGCGQPCDGDV